MKNIMVQHTGIKHYIIKMCKLLFSALVRAIILRTLLLWYLKKNYEILYLEVDFYITYQFFC